MRVSTLRQVPFDQETAIAPTRELEGTNPTPYPVQFMLLLPHLFPKLWRAWWYRPEGLFYPSQYQPAVEMSTP